MNIHNIVLKIFVIIYYFIFEVKFSEGKLQEICNNKLFSYFNDENLLIKNECLIKEKLEYCTHCIQNQNEKNCINCPALEILDELNILSPNATLDQIIYKKKSLARFADGEFDLIFHRNISFQKYNKSISNRLREILVSEEKDLLIGVNNDLNKSFLDNLNSNTKKFWNTYVSRNQFNLINVLNLNKTYASAKISRFYLDYKNKSDVKYYINKLKMIWDNKDIVIIEGDKSRLGIGNDLFDNAKSIQRILGPAENAYNVYDKLYEESLKVNKNKLILIALGPTATVLAYDLYKSGYQVIDIGHVDIEYEWYLRNVTKKVKIEYKYVNEIKRGKRNIKDITDKKYFEQIISVIKRKAKKTKKEKIRNKRRIKRRIIKKK